MSGSTDPQQFGDASARPQTWYLAIALCVFTSGAIALSALGWRQSVLFLIAGALGATLVKTGFGFTSTYRKLLVDRDATGMYAQLVMLAVATVLFAPILATGQVLARDVYGAIAPIGVSMSVGAFLFGIGMQLATGCASGTLSAVGGGSLSMVLTLVTFCVGSFLGSLTRIWWANLPAVSGIALGEVLNWPTAVLIQLGMFACVALFLQGWEKTAKAPISRSPWSNLLVGGVLLAVLNTLTLIVAGNPWAITWGFVLISGKVATLLGWDLSVYPYWGDASSQQSLQESLFADPTVVMDLGVMLGAFLAAAIAGRFALKAIPSWRAAIAASFGGLFMGYGALLAFGCNVNAFFGGIASTSLHGWLWIVLALMGSAVGIKLRSAIVPPSR